MDTLIIPLVVNCLLYLAILQSWILFLGGVVGLHVTRNKSRPEVLLEAIDKLDAISKIAVSAIYIINENTPVEEKLHKLQETSWFANNINIAVSTIGVFLGFWTMLNGLSEEKGTFAKIDEILLLIISALTLIQTFKSTAEIRRTFTELQTNESNISE